MFITCDLHINKEEIRLIECLNFLDYLKEQCIKENDMTLAVLGDIFNTSNNIKNQFFVPLFNKFLELKQCGIYLIFIPGNHDLITKDGRGTLAETFNAFGKFIREFTTLEIDGYNYDFLPYTEEEINFKSNSDVLLTHLSIEGFWPSNYHMQKEFENYNLVVSGHVHKYQDSGKFFFVGAPYSVNAGERTFRHGYARIQGPVITHYDYTDAPEYLIIKAEDFNNPNIDFNNKMVTVQLASKVENFVKLRSVLISKGAIDVTPEFIKTYVVDQNDDHKIDPSEGVTKTVAKYLSGVKADKIENSMLLECYKEVLKRTKSV